MALTRTGTGAIAALALLLGACGGEPDLSEVASEALGANVDELFFDPPVPLPPSVCSLNPVWATTSTAPFPLVFAELPDGSLLISDDHAHAIYRLRRGGAL